MGIRPGDRVLEVGAGTGINAPLYPRDCHVTAIDLSAPMLDRARARIARAGLDARANCSNRMRRRMPFPTIPSTASVAPYVISVVADPVRVAREMRRVCRRAGAS